MFHGNQAAFLFRQPETLNGAVVREWFEAPHALQHYARAAASIGLWRSEEVVYRSVFAPDARILDVGCGAGRIAFGLWRAGFHRLTGVDFAPAMVESARRLADAMGIPVSFETADVLNLPFAAASFDGLIFGFNGLMQIPGRVNRRLALNELCRITTPGGRFVFTTHDRDLDMFRAQWRDCGSCAGNTPDHTAYLEFGDRILETPEGRIFMHWPDRAEVLEDLRISGWLALEDRIRSTIANEPPAVREFADECRFWIVEKPAQSLPRTGADSGHSCREASV